MPRFGVHDVSDVTLWDLVTGEPVLFLNSLKMTTLENAADTSYATGGRGNGRILSWNFNRTAQFNIQNALLDPKALALQAGMTDVQTGAQTITKREIITLNGSGVGTLSTAAVNPSVTTAFAYVTTDGVNPDVGAGNKWTYVASAPAATTFTLSGTTFTNVAGGANKKLIIYYQITTAATASLITVNAGNFPGFYKATGDTTLRNELTGVDEGFQIILPKVKLQPNFNLTLQADGDPSVFDFNLEVYKDGNSDMVKFIKY